MKNAHSATLGIGIGNIIRLDYVQPVDGDPVRFGKVTDIRDTELDPVSYSYYRRGDSRFARSRHLVTVVDTLGQFRRFYLERTTKIVRPWFGRLRFAWRKFWKTDLETHEGAL